jgi:hypothetical protein
LNSIGARRKDELMRMADNVKIKLEKLYDIVTRYESLGLEQKKTWDRVRFAAEDLDDIRTTIVNHVGYRPKSTLFSCRHQLNKRELPSL